MCQRERTGDVEPIRNLIGAAALSAAFTTAVTSIGRAVDQALVGRGATQNHITGQGSVPKCEPDSVCAKDRPFLLIVAEVSQNLARKTRMI
jgi:hypothetical protein